jgi:hypothetical protein
MGINVVSMKGGFPPDLGKIVGDALVRVQQRAQALADATVGYVRGITPARTGYMRATVTSWSLRVYSRGGFVFWFGWRRGDYSGKRAFYPVFVNYGTGVYGLYGRPIYPRYARRLAWIHRGKWVSAESILGQRPQRMLERGKEFAKKRLRDIYQFEVMMGMRRTFT